MKFIACLIGAVLLFTLLLSFPTSAERNKIQFSSLSVPNPVSTAQDDGPVKAKMVAAKAQDPELNKHFRKYDVVKVDRDAVERQVKNRGRLMLSTSHGDFDLQFSPIDLRSADYEAREIDANGVAHKLPKTPANTYKATVKGDTRAQARVALGEHGLEGAIITGDKRYFIEPSRSLSKTAQADEFVFYSSEDVAPTNASCGVTLADEVAAQQNLTAASTKTGTSELVSPPDPAELASPITPLSPMKIARIATDADAEFVNASGGSAAANNQITQIINLVDGIYQVEVGITFQIVFQNTWTNAGTDPYTATVASDRLTQFEDFWNDHDPSGGIPRSLAHLFTGVNVTGGAPDFDTGVIGIAQTGTTCRFPEAAYGLSERFPSNGTINSTTVILTAHEIGHNFSAQHTNEPDEFLPPDFFISCENSIMEAALGSLTASSFCPYSRSQILSLATAYGSCLLTSGNAPPPSTCLETPITPGVTVNGSLSNTDCTSPSRGVRLFADRYTFDGTAGQQVTISMIQTSGTLDPYLYLIAPDGYIIDQADVGAGGANARIPEVSANGVFTLPQTGRYIVEATSKGVQQTGNYQLTVTPNGCTLSAAVNAQQFAAAGGTGTLSVTASGPCGNYSIVNDPATAGTNWIGLSQGGAAGSFSFNFTVNANSSSIGRRTFLLVGPSGGNSDTGGIRIPITQSGTGPDCSVTPIAIGQTLNGSLSNGDCASPLRNVSGLRADRYIFAAAAGTQISITTNVVTLSDTFVTLLGPNGAVILNDDDGGGGTNSRIPGGTGMLTLGISGTYTIEVSSFDAGQFGDYTVTLNGTTGSFVPTLLSSSQVELKSWQFEGRTFAYVKLTFPDAGFRVANWGTPVRAGNDFAADAVIERFTGGSIQAISSTAQIYDLGPLTPGNYTFTFKNSGTSVKTLNFTVSASPPPANPIDDPREFVRWQYKDFLRREPDGPGWDHWTGEITECSDVSKRFPGETEPQCVERKRANTSAAFFFSPEFQNTGYFVLRVYRGSLGRMPHFGGGNTVNDEFTRDAGTVSAGIVVNDALAPDVINANKQAFVQQFVTRTEFRGIYDGLNNTQYVDKLFQTTGVTPTGAERQALIDGLNGGSETRASVLFKVVDGTTTITGGLLVFNTNYGKAFYDNLFNAAFVQMEYFGYLLRDPDDAGYAFWLGKLNAAGNWVDAQMVLAFIKSPEYRSRFGAP